MAIAQSIARAIPPLICFALVGCGTENPPKRAHSVTIDRAPIIYDPENDSAIEIVFPFRNAAPEDVVIFRTTTDCGCLQADVTPATIPAGGEGEVRATMRVLGYDGVYRTSIICSTNLGPFTYRISQPLYPQVSFSNPEVYLSKQSASAEKARRYTFSINTYADKDEPPPEIIELACVSSLAELEIGDEAITLLANGVSRRTSEFHITCPSELPPGQYDDDIRVVTSAGGVAKMRLHYEVASEFVFSPERVFINAIASNETTDKSVGFAGDVSSHMGAARTVVILRHTNGAPISVRGLNCTTPGVNARILDTSTEPPMANDMVAIEITVDINAVDSAAVWTNVVVELDGPGGPLKLPVAVLK